MRLSDNYQRDGSRPVATKEIFSILVMAELFYLYFTLLPKLISK